MGLSYDEAYYWVYSQFLSWGYFDHPPMVAALIKMGYSIFPNEFGVRFFFNILSVSTLWLLWDLSTKKNKFLFICLSLSLPLVQSAGILALPDTPLLFFSVLFLWTTNRYLKEESVLNIFLVSLSIACMFYSKYHGLLIVLLTVMAVPHLLKKKSFWIIAATSAFLFLPHMYWQYLNDFVSFKFHLTGRAEKHFELANILNYITSQLVLFGMGFFVWFCFIIKKINRKDYFERILIFNVLGFLIFLFFVSFRNQVEANWTVSACACFLILMERLIPQYEKRKLILALTIFPALLFLSLRLILSLPSSFYEGQNIGRLNEIKNWEKRIEMFRDIVGDSTVVSETYQYGAKFSFELKKIIPVKHFRGRDSHYSLLNLTKNINKDEPIYYLTPNKQKNAVIIETDYKDPIFIIKTTLRELEEKHNDN